MKVRIWPAGALLPDGSSNDGCTEYRLLGPARPLIAQGADIVIDDRGPTVLWDHDWSKLPEPPAGVSIMGLAKDPDADVIVIQRPGRRWWADVIPMLQREGIKVVVDVDDRFDRIDRDNIAYPAYDPTKSTIHNFNWVELACRRADVVTCATPALMARYSFGHGVLLPNLVPERYLNVRAETRFATVGWSGTVETHPTDLQVTAGAVGRILDDTGWSFHHIGTGKGVKDALKLSMEPTNSGWVPFADYADRMGEVSIGIVPLVDTKFNQAKSCLKMIEYAALGVPVIASATPDNDRMRKLGVGVTVKHPAQWERTLRRMVTDRDYREDVAGKGREVMADHTYERKASMWWDVWAGNQEKRAGRVFK